MRKAAFVYTKEFEKVNYGPDHPFRAERFSETISFFKSKFNDTPIIEPQLIDEEILLEVHSKRYVEEVKEYSKKGYGFLSIDTPVFKGIFEWALWYSSASYHALRLVLDRKYDVVFNPCGGLHHAKKDSDGGFCVFNDVALIAKIAFNEGRNAAIVDYDAHAGDGTMRILYDLPILKISIHEDPYFLYPGDGFIEQVGKGKGYGYTLNIPLPPYSGDDILIDAFKDIIIPAIKNYKPEILIIQSGVDGYYNDPLTHLRYTVWGYFEISKMLRSLNLPTVILGGGGYYLPMIPILWGVIFAIHSDRLANIRDIIEKLGEESTKSENHVWKSYKITKKQIINSHPILSP